MVYRLNGHMIERELDSVMKEFYINRINLVVNRTARYETGIVTFQQPLYTINNKVVAAIKLGFGVTVYGTSLRYQCIRRSELVWYIEASHHQA